MVRINLLARIFDCSSVKFQGLNRRRGPPLMPRISTDTQSPLRAVTRPKPEDWADNDPTLSFLGELASHAESSLLHEILERLVVFATSLVESDSCFVFVRDGEDPVSGSSKNHHQKILGRLTRGRVVRVIKPQNPSFTNM